MLETPREAAHTTVGTVRRYHGRPALSHALPSVSGLCNTCALPLLMCRLSSWKVSSARSGRLAPPLLLGFSISAFPSAWPSRKPFSDSVSCSSPLQFLPVRAGSPWAPPPHSPDSGSTASVWQQKKAGTAPSPRLPTLTFLQGNTLHYLMPLRYKVFIDCDFAWQIIFRD